MNCPICSAEMEPGTLDLKAWGFGIAPQARLHFDDELIAKDQYIPVLGLFTQGRKLAAQRCKACSLVSFQYPR
jgi:hypothetical protein